VDDEPSIVDAVATALRYEGYEVSEARTGRDGLAAAQSDQPDLIVLDVMLPDVDGFEIARRIRADGLSIPILFLTAKDALHEKMHGFSVGADDYVTKPFSLAEMVVRVRAIIQRTHGAATSTSHQLTYADVILDTDTHEVWRNGTNVELTATEFKLLRFFLMNPGRVLSKPQILDHVWHYDFDGDANILETYISYLRRKLNKFGPSLIHTVRLVGYVMREAQSDK
jgi:two-component system OmpR family response regulator